MRPSGFQGFHRRDDGHPAMGRFAWLMGLYAENHLRLARLFDPAPLVRGAYRSMGRDGLALEVEVVQRHAWMVEMRMSYALRDPETGLPDPSAHVRYYLDSRQAEVTHCYVGRRWQDVLGLAPPAKAVLAHRLRMNAFLNKWLDYLAQQGHAPGTLERVGDAAPDADGKNVVASA